MNSCHHKRIISSIFIGLFVLLIGQQQVQGQKEKPLNLIEIRKILVFRSSPAESREEINKTLIADISERKVNFILTSEDEESLKKAGGNNLLVEAIRENLLEELKEQMMLYQKYLDNYNGNFEQKKIAVEAAKEFVKKYSGNRDAKTLIDYFINVIPLLEGVTDNYDPPNPRRKSYFKFENSFKTKKWNDLFEAGAEILKTEPEFVDVTLVLASVGFENADKESKSNYLDQILGYAGESINLLERGKTSSTKNYGAYDYSYKTKEFPDGKANALGYMNYIIGYIKYFYLNQKDEAIPYFQKSLSYKSKSNELIRQLNLPFEIKR